MPDLSSFILHTQDMHLAPSCSLQCGASVSGNHTIAPQLPSSSRIQHQIHAFRLPANYLADGILDGEGGQSMLCGWEQLLLRELPPSEFYRQAACRQQLLSCSFTPLPLLRGVPSPTFPLKPEHSCRSKSELLMLIIKTFKENYFSDLHYGEMIAKQNQR